MTNSTLAPLSGRFSQTWAVRLVIVVIVLATIVFSAVLWITGPPVWWDPSLGFLVRTSMLRGAPFNYQRLVSQTNLNQDVDRFYAVFSPGQYVLPDALTRLGFSLGNAVALVVILSMALGLLGYYWLYRRLGFSKLVAVLSCAILLTTRLSTRQFNMYSGGAVLQFGSMPFVIMAAMTLASWGGLYLLLLPLLFLLGAFLKLTYTLIALSIVLWICLEQLFAERSPAMKRFLSIGIVGGGYLVFYFLVWWLDSSRGQTASGFQFAGLHVRSVILVLTYSVAAICGGIVDVFGPIARLRMPLDFVMLRNLTGPVPLTWIAITTVVAVMSAALIVMVWRRSSWAYRTLIGAFIVVHVFAFSMLIPQGWVSLELRHFWPCSVLILPGLVKAAASAKLPYRVAAIAVFGIAVLYGLSSYVAGAVYMRHGGRTVQGIRVPGVSQRVVDEIQTLDNRDLQRRVVFVIPEPSLAMTILRHPVICTRNMYERPEPHYGTADRVIAIMPVGNPLAQHLTDRFPDEGPWQTETVDGYMFTTADASSSH